MQEESKWSCKCGCISKQSHRSRWAFISRYKCNHLTKYKNIIEDEQSNNSLINKLLLKRTNSDKESIQFIPVKRVKFDVNTGKIIIEENSNKEPFNEELLNEEPVIKEPVIEEPVIEEPVNEEPVNEEIKLGSIEKITQEQNNNLITKQLDYEKNIKLNEKNKVNQNSIIIENNLIDLKDLINKFC
jgi:hypothetical protein